MMVQSDIFFFFNDTATTEIYTLSLHDALPIFHVDAVGRYHDVGMVVGHTALLGHALAHAGQAPGARWAVAPALRCQDRKSTRLNSSHANISYAVFCLKKKKNILCVIAASCCLL